MTEVFKENELNLIRVYLMSKGNEVDVLFDHDAPGEFKVDIDTRLTVHFNEKSEFQLDYFLCGVEERNGKEKVLTYLLSLCDEYPNDKLSNEELPVFLKRNTIRG